MNCRHCNANDFLPMLDLGSAPPSNAYLSKSTLYAPERWFPLKVKVCSTCWLAQTEDTSGAEELFDSQYAYFSSFSITWLKHAETYALDMQTRFSLGNGSHVVEIAANDGYLLQYVKALGIPCLGIEPTASTATAARAKGIDIIEEFFGVRLANELVRLGKQSDLIAANNVLAHVPDINDFVAGCAILLTPQGVATFEFPHLLQLVAQNQFDTIYHEHFSYLSLTAVKRIFAQNGLSVFDVQELPTHGGSLRVFAQRQTTGVHAISPSVLEVSESEQAAGVTTASYYSDAQSRADYAKNALLSFLIDAKNTGKKVGAYGAAAKGNTLFNYAGVRPDLVPWVIDKNPAKKGKYLPGSRIPIVDEDCLRKERPDYLVILPWNLRLEVMAQLDYVREWGCRFVTAIPNMRIV